MKIAVEYVLNIVRCRAGSLEIRKSTQRLVPKVRCRAGSLEKIVCIRPDKDPRSLPRRQLRKIRHTTIMDTVRSLPRRQLRKRDALH